MKTVKEKREIILRYVDHLLIRERMGGNDGIHKIIFFE
jgi:hypothetical protein